MLALVADYRLYPEVRFTAFLADNALVLGSGMKHAADQGGKPQRVVIMGHGAAAHNAATLATDPRYTGRRQRTTRSASRCRAAASPDTQAVSRRLRCINSSPARPTAIIA